MVMVHSTSRVMDGVWECMRKDLLCAYHLVLRLMQYHLTFPYHLVFPHHLMQLAFIFSAWSDCIVIFWRSQRRYCNAFDFGCDSDCAVPCNVMSFSSCLSFRKRLWSLTCCFNIEFPIFICLSRFPCDGCVKQTARRWLDITLGWFVNSWVLYCVGLHFCFADWFVAFVGVAFLEVVVVACASCSDWNPQA
jgi:hypothetical protein